MTLVIALKKVTREGEEIVMSSDSRVSYGPIAYEAKKIFPIYLKHDEEVINLAITGGAGDTSLVKYSYYLAKSILEERCKQKGFKCLTYDEFDATTKEIESKLISKFSSLRRVLKRKQEILKIL